MDTTKILNENRPKFGHRRGCTWDLVVLLTPGGKIYGHYDSTWGRWIHFEYRGKWKKVSIHHPAIECNCYKTIDLVPYLT